MRAVRLSLALLLAGGPAAWAGPDLPAPPPLTPVRVLAAAADFSHATGRIGHTGWESDYRGDGPGYSIDHARAPLLLAPGYYRMTFSLRRGHYPLRGFLHDSFPLFRLELWDLTANRRLLAREIQIGDIERPNRFEPRWMDFSMAGLEGHALEPRVFWFGLANGEVGSVAIDRYPDVDLGALEQKADRVQQQLETTFLENGFVVSRREDGTPDETGDAVTYTGLYVAALAWKYAVTHDELTYGALENGLAALHNAIKGDMEHPVIVRFVDADDQPAPTPPSKDVYTAFYFAYGAAYPRISNRALRAQMRADLVRITDRLLTDGLTVRIGSHSMLNLTPYFTDDDLRDGISQLFADRREKKSLLKALNAADRLVPFQEIWPGMKDVMLAIENNDSDRLFALAVPTMNGALSALERVREVLKAGYRDDLLFSSMATDAYPGARLERLAADALGRLPAHKDGRRLARLSDLRVLASNAILSLSLVKTALAVTAAPQFTDYYANNLYGQDALLKTALDWYGADDKAARWAAGNEVADRERRGYLTILALGNLISLEKNPAIRNEYRSLLAREVADYRFDDNPLVTAFALASDEGGDRDQILRDLAQFPEPNQGFGNAFWRHHGEAIGQREGGGADEGYSREALPVAVRPRDSFIWQRNARRLSGDDTRLYPGTAYLFVYWYARLHGLIGGAPPMANVERPSARLDR